MRSVCCGLIMILIILAYKGELMAETKTTLTSINEIQQSQWENLARKCIIFGHQSVGKNIMDGIAKIVKENPFIALDIKESADPNDMAPGTLAHFAVGKNGNAESKIQDFEEKIRSQSGGKIDIALFKFCFVDIDAKTDVNHLFDAYKRTMDGLHKDFPDISFVHVTVPLLRKEETTLKILVKKILGQTDGFFADAHNIKRTDYNNLLVKEYSGKDPIFDLAKIESREGANQYDKNGKIFYALASEYTDDGGHLNELGRKIVAEHFLKCISEIK
jgi:hypothetical protein